MFLQGLCANDVARGPGRITYTSLLNSRGGTECDLTVTQLTDDTFLVVTGTAFGRHDLSWLAQHAPADGTVALRDVTASLACFALWGPAAPAILAEACDDDLSFGYMAARRITVGDVPCLALRVTYVGEKGWELYPSAEYGQALWDTLVAAGRPHGLVPGGYRAIDALRLEKGYRSWGADITGETDPYSAGLGFAVRAGKAGGFLGDEALAAVPNEGGSQRLVCLVLADPRAAALGNEPVKTPDGAVVGRVSSGGIGYALGLSIAYAWVPAGHAAPGTALAVEVFGDTVPAEVRADPLYDPTGARLRG